jgi:RNA 2',3'-cyclic 3'-phosphodiesterase
MTNETSTPPPAPTPIRTFVAIDLPPGVKALVGEIQNEMRSFIGDPANAVKWVRPAGIHLTLQFLGNVMSDRIPDVQSTLQVATSGAKPFTLQLGELGAFPNMKQPRVIWLGLTSDPEGHQELSKLQSSVSYRLQDMGFAPDKSFKPHLTLGRMREDVSRNDLTSLATSISDLAARAVFEAQFKVQSISLMKSVLHPGGAVYTQLAEIEFGRK